MTLGDRQREFTRRIALLILKASEMGYELTFGDAYRDPRVFGRKGEKKGYGHPDSYHKLRLAVDFNLFKDGRYLFETEDHRELGEWWKEEMGGVWGGDFNDGNHYQEAPNGNWKDIV